MSRMFKIWLLTTLLFFSVFLTVQWLEAVRSEQREANSRLAELDRKVRELKNHSHPPWRVISWRFAISTSDRPANTNWNASYHVDEFRLIHGTNALQRFGLSEHGYISKSSGRIVKAWVSDWSPRSEMAKFEQLIVEPHSRAPWVEVFAKARTNESLSMEFEVTALLESTSFAP